MSLAIVHKDFLFPKSLSTLVVSYLFDNRHSDRYEVTHCNLDFSLIISDAQHFYLVAICMPSLENVFSYHIFHILIRFLKI